MDFDSTSFKKFVADAKEKAINQLSSMNVGQDFKDVLSNLLKIVDSTEELIRSGQGQSADVRVLKAKHEQTRTELFQTQKKLEAIKKEFLNSISDEVIQLSKEVKSIQKLSLENQEVLKSCKSIQNSIRNIINKVGEVTK